MRLRHMRVKICLVGDRGVGKTSLIRRFAADQYMPEEKGTLGAHLTTVQVSVPLDQEIAKVKVDLFDFMGEHALRDNFRDAIFYGAHGVLAVCDLSRPLTLISLTDWIHAVSAVAPGVPGVVAFNKADLGQNVAIGASDMRLTMDTLPGVTSVITSARTGQGVDEAFNRIVLQAVEGILAADRRVKERESLRYEILSVIAHRGITGRSKGEIIGAFRSRDPKLIMEEIDNLVELGLIQPVEYSAETFVDTRSVPVNTRFTITEQGKEAVTSPRPGELVVGEP